MYLVASTGIIGVQLDMDIITKGIRKLVEVSADGGQDLANAIMTTDTIIKAITVETTIGGKE